jgi:hypothetical protein
MSKTDEITTVLIVIFTLIIWIVIFGLTLILSGF